MSLAKSSQASRVGRLIRKHLNFLIEQFKEVEDSRREHPSRRWALWEILHFVTALVVAGYESAQAGDTAMQEKSPLMKQLGVRRRVPDSTYQELLGQQPERSLLPVLGAWVRLLYRSKTWQRPAAQAGRSRPLGTCAIDGKSLKKSGERAFPELRRLRHVLRAQFTGWGPALCIGQMQVPDGTNENGTFAAFFGWLMSQYGRFSGWLECFTLDAGFCTRANAELIVSAGRDYIMGLKDNQPTLILEAKRLLEPRMLGDTGSKADAYYVDKQQGRPIIYELWRTAEMQGWMDFPGLRQVWLVRRQVTQPDGSTSVGRRYFASSLSENRLTPLELLAQVRLHWSVENKLFWRLDTQFDEDRRRFATVGEALPTMGLLRVLAFNLLMLLKDRSLRQRRPPRESLPGFIRWLGQLLSWLDGYEAGRQQGLREALEAGI